MVPHEKTALLLVLLLQGSAGNWIGTISDEHCGAKHVQGGTVDQKCVTMCIRGGASAVFVVTGKAYRIDNPDAIKCCLGMKVEISGKVAGNTIHVDSVKE